MLVPCFPCPYGRQRKHMGKVQAAHKILADIVPGHTGNRTHPRINGVRCFMYCRETSAVDGLFNHTHSRINLFLALIHYNDDLCELAEADHICPQLLQGHLSIIIFFQRIRVHHCAFALGNGLFQLCPNGFTAGEPLPPVIFYLVLSIHLIQRQIPCNPTIFKIQAVQSIQDSRCGFLRESFDRYNA